MNGQIKRRGLLRVAAMAGLLTVPGGVARAMAANPVAPIQQLDAALLAVMKAGSATPFVQRFAMLAPVVEQTFDLPQVLRNSVGLAWSGLPAAQQAALQKAFRRYTVATFVSNFDSYDGQRFEISSNLRTVMPGEIVVPTRIVPRSGKPTSLDYVMRHVPGGWGAVDVLADGSISRVAVQRSDFQSLLANGDGAALIASLRRKVQTLSSGELA